MVAGPTATNTAEQPQSTAAADQEVADALPPCITVNRLAAAPPTRPHTSGGVRPCLRLRFLQRFRRRRAGIILPPPLPLMDASSKRIPPPATVAHAIASHVLQKRMENPATPSSAEFGIESLSANSSAKSCKVWNCLGELDVCGRVGGAAARCMRSCGELRRAAAG
jgi:hypothetical protein